MRGPRPRVSPHLAHQPILPQWLSKIACPLPPLLSYLMPVHPPWPASAFLSPATVCMCAARVSILRVRLRGAPLPIPQARAARTCFPSWLPAPLRVARTKQDPDTRARTRGELGGGCGGVKERRGATESAGTRLLAVWLAEVASQRGEEAAEMAGGLHAEGEAQAERRANN